MFLCSIFMPTHQEYVCVGTAFYANIHVCVCVPLYTVIIGVIMMFFIIVYLEKLEKIAEIFRKANLIYGVIFFKKFNILYFWSVFSV